MGSSISRIEREFIIKALDDNKIPVKLHGTRKEAEVVILNYEDEKTVEVHSKERALSDFKKGEQVSVFFSYYGHVMTFESKIVSCDEEKATLKYPDLILKNLQRKYERVNPPEGVDISFVVDNVKIELSFPESETFFKLEDFSGNNSFDTSSINTLIEEFRGIISTHCDLNKIIMFRDRQPETFEEKLIARTGKIFFMQSIYEGMVLPDTDKDIPIIDKSRLNPDEIEELLSDMKKQGQYSVVYCPVLYQEYTVGYVYLCNKKNKKISVDTVEYVYQFSKILAWVLKKNGYFAKGKPVSQEFHSQLVDISASGLMFADNSENLAEALNIYTDIKINLRIGKRTIPTSCRVMRKFHNKGMTFYGIQYMDIDPEDFSYLFEYVYGRMFTETDNNLWEGGSRPPTLEL